MKKILVLMLLMVQTSLLCAQNNPFSEYRVFVSPSIFFIDGVQKEENKLKDEKKMYYDNGNLKSEFTMLDNSMEGEIKEYYESGKIKLKGNYKSSKRDGEQKAFFETGEVKGIYNYRNGVLEAESKEFLENGNVLRKLNSIRINDSIVKGNLIEYNYQSARKAKIRSIGSKKVKVVNVPQKRFLVYNFRYINGRPDGDQIYFGRKGKKEELKKYLNSELKSHFFYDSKGQLTLEKHFESIDSKQKWKSYYSDGKLKNLFLANKNITIDSVFYQNGNLKEYKKTNWDYVLEKKKFFENKIVKYFSKSIKNKGERLNKIIRYHENGKMKSNATYSRTGKIVGNWKTFYDNTNVKCFNKISRNIEREFCYYENGNKKSVETYLINKNKKRVKHKFFEYYYDNGQLIRSFEWDKNQLLDVDGWFTKKGVKLKIGDFKKGNGKVIYYNDRNEVRVIKKYEKGKITDSYYE